ncbi:hypothetical protein SAMN04487958_107161 [Vreelandella subterranea]|uniref:Uncharacterized protein n=1 Tax=Vreelandella subterranea TaxID=416874 RepID=A0A1H9UQK3_9GAMM|nr:hypothetical protein [Halomonas subterranea]SES11765.1 hypothetical protein SAMN04487958_107161 [Halomonas subterranea]
MTTNADLALEEFMENVANHSMEVLQDNGKYRHLRFSHKGSSIYHFNIVTWPGYLAIAGDMGDFMFSRVPDMFEFFRSEKPGLHINASYWAGKLKAGGSGGSQFAKVWCEEAFKRNILREFEYWAEVQDDEARVAGVRAKLNHEVLEFGNFKEEAAQAVLDWDNEALDLTDFWECDCTDFDHHYLICCYAIVWAIQQYDAAKQEAA